jgi:hypothetical protein
LVAATQSRIWQGNRAVQSPDFAGDAATASRHWLAVNEGDELKACGRFEIVQRLSETMTNRCLI